VLTFLGKAWNNSLMARGLAKCGAFFRFLFSASAFIAFVTREGTVNRAYEGSILFRAVDGMLNLPQRLLHPLYKKSEAVFAQSFFFRMLLLLLDRLYLLAGGFLFLALVVRYDRWNNMYSMLAMAAILVLYFIRTIVEGRTGFQTKALNVFLVLFLICVLFGQIFSIIPSGSLRFLGYYLTGFMAFMAMLVSIRTRKELSGVILFSLCGMTVAGLFGIYQYVIKVPVNPAWIDTTLNQGGMTRVFSFFNNPNDYAEVILLFVPFYFAAAFHAKKPLMKLVYLAMSVPPLISMLMTLSRGAWVALALAAVVYVFFTDKRLVPLFVILGLAAIPFLPQSILLRLRTLLNFSDNSFKTRSEIWKTIMPILKDYWFTGLGLGNETLLRVSKNYYSFIAKGSIPSHSHNLFLQLWLETGIAGITAFVAFILTTVKKSIRIIAQTKDAFIKHILIAGLASLTGILANGLFEYVWFDRRVMLFFWVVVGWVFAAMNIRIMEEKESGGEMALKSMDEPQEEVA